MRKASIYHTKYALLLVFEYSWYSRTLWMVMLRSVSFVSPRVSSVRQSLVSGEKKKFRISLPGAAASRRHSQKCKTKKKGAAASRLTGSNPAGGDSGGSRANRGSWTAGGRAAYNRIAQKFWEFGRRETVEELQRIVEQYKTLQDSTSEVLRIRENWTLLNWYTGWSSCSCVKVFVLYCSVTCV